LNKNEGIIKTFVLKCVAIFWFDLYYIVKSSLH